MDKVREMTAKYLQNRGKIKNVISQQYPASAPNPTSLHRWRRSFSTSRMTIQQAMSPVNRRRADLYPRKGRAPLCRKYFLQLSQWELPRQRLFQRHQNLEHLARCWRSGAAVRFPSDKEQSSIAYRRSPVYDYCLPAAAQRRAGIAGFDGHAGGLVPGLTKAILEGSVFRYAQETLG